MGEQAAISFEEFGLVQNQLIELKTEKYNLAENLKRVSAEWKRLGEENAKTKKELEKVNKVVATSRKNQEVAEILNENENLNRRLLMQEEDFRVQNQTLLLEITNLTAENKELRNNPESSSSSTSDALQKEKDSLKLELQSLEEKIERKHGVVQTLTAEKQQLIDAHEAEKRRLSADFQAEIQELSATNDRLLSEKEECLGSLAAQEERHRSTVKTLEKKVSLSSADAVKLLRDDVKTLKERLSKSVETGETFERELREREKEVTQCRDEIIPRLTNELTRAEEASAAALARAEADARRLEETAKLAEKRKTIIDEMAIRAQKEAEGFAADMTETRGKLEEALRSGEEKKVEMRKKGVEFDKLLNKLAEAKSQITSLENANGWFERRLAEADSQSEAAKVETEEKLKRFKEEMESKAKSDAAEWEMERQLLLSQLEEFQGEKSALNATLDQLKSEIKDSADNYKIKERKNIQLAKDLKKQLINEQKRCAKLQDRLQQVLSESQLSFSGIEDDFSLSMSVDEDNRRADTTSSVSSWSLVHSSTNGAGRTPSDHGSVGRQGPNATDFTAGETPPPALAEENARLVQRLAQLQECVWSGEERIQYLETTNAAMADDLVQKSALIDHYSMRGFQDSFSSEQNSPAHQSSSSTNVVGAESKEQHQQQQQQQPFRKVLDFVREVKEITEGDGGKKETEALRRRMGKMLEETLTKNMALQNDLEKLSDEVTRLNEELELAKGGG